MGKIEITPREPKPLSFEEALEQAKRDRYERTLRIAKRQAERWRHTLDWLSTR